MMNSATSSRTSLTNVGIEGVLLTLAALPFLLASAGAVGEGPVAWRLIASSVASLFCLSASMLLLRRTLLGKIFGCLALGGCGIAGFPYFVTEPQIALFGGVIFIQSSYFLKEFRVRQHPSFCNSPPDRSLQRARGALWTVPPIAFSGFFLDPAGQTIGEMAIAATLLISQGLVAHWAGRRHKGFLYRKGISFVRADKLLNSALTIAWMFLPLVASIGGLFALFFGQAKLAALCISLLTLVALPRPRSPLEYHEHWWELFLNHPARVLISTFLGLCLFGTLLLQLPWASAKGNIALVDAAFTSVSAVCVTGLTVLDTPYDFTLLGQWFILILIQLGGFGIMTISTVALHVMGKRLSLRQERLLTTLTETSHSDLIGSLVIIVQFTLLTELVGAALLTGCFLNVGDSFATAAWRGLFTSISAFCNAGFALQSNNLVTYQANPLVLHIVAALIILGGLAPATCLVLPAWIRGRIIPLAPRIALMTTATLLLIGTGCFLIFEWNSAMAGLSFADKVHNAWFQSATLRTAGFNSVEISGVLEPTFLIMLCLMFIGGSPGGTAGGVKTTTVGVLAMTFWASITGHNEVIAQNRRIPQSTINRAITVVGSGVLVWFFAVLALQITQQLPARELAFEVTSALGTVGLSLGATPHLDEIGKIIIILTMFIGRIGPMTLFTLLSLDVVPADSRCPDARITLN
jgi:trk system potassium uptake protein